MRAIFAALAAALALSPAIGQAQVTNYDLATNVLSIPSVSVGSSSYTGVTLLNTGNFIFSLQSATAQVPAAPGVASYDAATNVVTLPAVKVGDATYLNVTLLNIGNFVFTLQSATPLPAATLNEVKALFVNFDALWANAVPASGALRYSLADGCWVDGGRTRAYAISDYDTNLAEWLGRNAYRVGQRSTNIQVLAERNRVNPDSSTRREIDVQFDIVYRDGTTTTAFATTLISGSSSGAPGCTSPQAGSGLRFFGDRKLVLASVHSRNLRDERYSVTNGSELTPLVNYRRDLQWVVTDPLGNATYVIVSGPGPTANVNGVVTPFSLKLISPRLLRSAPELAGKTGNFLNWRDDDAFRNCRVSNSALIPVAAIADCVNQGATAYDIGTTASAPNAAADATFAALGFTAGGTYVFAIYNDDGWKTVNGHAGRTPVAVYSETLGRLPYTFVELAGSGVNDDKYPRLHFGALTPVQVQTNLVSATPAALTVNWNALPALPDANRFGLLQGWEYFQGSKVGNSGSAYYPAYRTLNYVFPGSAAASVTGWPVMAKPAQMSSKSYEEYLLQYTDRNDIQIQSRVSFN